MSDKPTQAQMNLMVCGKCGGEMTIRCEITVRFPFEVFGNLSKKSIRRSDVVLEAVDWHKARFKCYDCLMYGI